MLSLCIYIYLYKIVYLVFRGLLVSFAQGGTCLTCTPFNVFSAPFLFRLPALPVMAGGGGRVYARDWGVGGGGLLL